MPNILTILIGLSLISCAHIQPTHKLDNNYEETAIDIPDDENDDNNIAPTDTLASAPVFKKSEKNFLERRNSKKVNFWIDYFSKKNKNRLERFVANGEKYKSIIEETFSRYGLPKELYYVGLIESGYYNAAKSHAGAVGPWQFMPSTARRYGLRVNHKIDERKNIFKSTEAAALFFQDLYNIFGSWELALAAYNKGENGVIRRIRGANTRDYYELSRKKVLPKETRHYVPKVLAVMTILENIDHYGVKVKKWQDNPFAEATKIEVDKSIKISTLAKKLNVPTSYIKQLNQDLKGTYIPYPGRNPIEIYVPSSSKESIASFNKYLANIKSQKRSPRQNTKKIEYHKVRRNESLYSLAKRYNTSISQLKRLNNLKRNTIFVGQKIKVSSQSHARVVYSYTVKRGDNLSTIAKIFKLSPQKLKQMNKLRSSRIYVGSKLQVPPHKKVTYTVRKGDSLGRIAVKKRVSLAQLLRLNGNKNQIYPGQKIVLELKLI